MKGQTEEPIYAEANNNFSKEVTGSANTLIFRQTPNLKVALKAFSH